MLKTKKCATLLAQCATFKIEMAQQKPRNCKGLRGVCATLPLFSSINYTERKKEIYKLLSVPKKWHNGTQEKKDLKGGIPWISIRLRKENNHVLLKRMLRRRTLKS